MAKFVIQPHGRLNDWVAEEKGYFTEEGLDYWLNLDASYKPVPQLSAVFSDEPLKDQFHGAFERYAEGSGRKGDVKNAGDVSCACHWTVNQSAKLEDGIMYGKSYSVCEAAIVVPGDSQVAAGVTSQFGDSLLTSASSCCRVNQVPGEWGEQSRERVTLCSGWCGETDGERS